MAANLFGSHCSCPGRKGQLVHMYEPSRNLSTQIRNMSGTNEGS